MISPTRVSSISMPSWPPLLAAKTELSLGTVYPPLIRVSRGRLTRERPPSVQPTLSSIIVSVRMPPWSMPARRMVAAPSFRSPRPAAAAGCRGSTNTTTAVRITANRIRKRMRFRSTWRFFFGGGASSGG